MFAECRYAKCRYSECRGVLLEGQNTASENLRNIYRSKYAQWTEDFTI